MPSLQDALSGVKFTPAPKIRPQKPAAAPKKPKKPKAKLPRVVAVGSFDFGRREVFGTKDRHSESRPPPEHEYFPERHFGGPIYTNVKPYYPDTIHRTSK